MQYGKVSLYCFLSSLSTGVFVETLDTIFSWELVSRSDYDNERFEECLRDARREMSTYQFSPYDLQDFVITPYQLELPFDE